MAAREFEDRLDSLIAYHAGRLWPDIDWRVIKAQAAQESGMRLTARSGHGALGLMQLMPATFAEVMPQGDINDPDDNLTAGILYLKEQFDHLGEIPDEAERLRLSLAAYNGGRGYVNAALRLARLSEDITSPATPGRWQRWETARTFLAAEGCTVNGKRPDYRQMWDYVERIMARFAAYVPADSVRAEASKHEGREAA
jgi:membrane-bound lytic murein transglycosylase MltF